MVAFCKAFTQQHSVALTKVFCAHLKEHLKTTLNVLIPIAGTNLLATEYGPNRKFFWCLFVVQCFVFLANATKENAQYICSLLFSFIYIGI